MRRVPEPDTLRGEAQRYRGEARSSAGSVESPRRVDRGEMHLAVVSSGHACLGREGLLENDEKRYEDALAVACPYGAPARRVVCRGAGRERPAASSARRSGWVARAPAPSPTASAASVCRVSGHAEYGPLPVDCVRLVCACFGRVTGHSREAPTRSSGRCRPSATSNGLVRSMAPSSIFGSACRYFIVDATHWWPSPGAMTAIGASRRATGR